jgi:FixJ family two-component response regulator
VSVLERLAMSSRTSTIPVIVVTGSGDAVLERRATEAGALRILKKPVEPTALLDAVREAIGEPA